MPVPEDLEIRGPDAHFQENPYELFNHTEYVYRPAVVQSDFSFKGLESPAYPRLFLEHPALNFDEAAQYDLKPNFYTFGTPRSLFDGPDLAVQITTDKEMAMVEGQANAAVDQTQAMATEENKVLAAEAEDEQVLAVEDQAQPVEVEENKAENQAQTLAGAEQDPPNLTSSVSARRTRMPRSKCNPKIEKTIYYVFEWDTRTLAMGDSKAAAEKMGFNYKTLVHYKYEINRGLKYGVIIVSDRRPLFPNSEESGLGPDSTISDLSNLNKRYAKDPSKKKNEAAGMARRKTKKSRKGQEAAAANRRIVKD